MMAEDRAVDHVIAEQLAGPPVIHHFVDLEAQRADAAQAAQPAGLVIARCHDAARRVGELAQPLMIGEHRPAHVDRRAQPRPVGKTLAPAQLVIAQGCDGHEIRPPVVLNGRDKIYQAINKFASAALLSEQRKTAQGRVRLTGCRIWI